MMQLSAIILGVYFSCAVVSSTVRDESPKLMTIQLQSRRINLMNRQAKGNGHNLPLGNIFKGTDLQVSYNNSCHP
jgi:hypothetical protein